jgi:hypothetical protein
MALLMYEDARNAADQHGAGLVFLESAYHAGAKLADWDVSDFHA